MSTTADHVLRPLCKKTANQELEKHAKPDKPEQKWRTQVLTEATPPTTRALLLFVHSRAVWAVREWMMFIPDFVEEVDLVLSQEQRRCDAVHGRITPAL